MNYDFLRKTAFGLALMSGLTFSSYPQKDTIQSALLNIESNDDFSGFAMLDSVLGNYTVFLTGENHLFRKSNYMLQLKMLRYLHKKAGVKHLFLEFGYSRGWLVNKYVHSGDSSLFKILSDYSFEEYALLYKGIWEYNKTLDSADRVSVTGIDIERSYSTPMKVLSLMLPENAPPDSIALMVESIKALALLNDSKHEKKEEDDDGSHKTNYNSGTRHFSDRKSVVNVLQDFKKKRQLFLQYVGKDSSEFSLIMEGLEAEIQREDYYSTVQEYIYREQYMYSNFIKMTARYPGEKFYAQFGRCHTAVEQQDKWCGYFYFKTLASRINHTEDPRLKGKICAIASFYPESTSYEKNVASEEKIENLRLLAKDNELTLFRVKSDSVTHEKFKNKFQFVIINRKKIEGESVKDEKKETSKVFDDSKFDYYYLFNFEAVAGVRTLNLKKFNAAVSDMTNGNFSLKTPLLTYGAGVSYIYDELDFATLHYLYILPQEYAFNDTNKISFSGNMFRLAGGAEVTMSNVFNFSFYGGLAYNTLKFEHRQEFPSEPGSSIFSAHRTEINEYTNPAVLVDAGTDFHLNLWFLTLGINCGYQFDLSDRKWRLNGSIDPASSPTSLSGFYLNVTGGIFIRL